MEEKTKPNAMLAMSRDLGLIDAFGEEGERIWIRQAGRTRSYTVREAERLVDEMMRHAPLLRKIMEECPRNGSPCNGSARRHAEGDNQA